MFTCIADGNLGSASASSGNTIQIPASGYYWYNLIIYKGNYNTLTFSGSGVQKIKGTTESGTIAELSPTSGYTYNITNYPVIIATISTTITATLS